MMLGGETASKPHNKTAATDAGFAIRYSMGHILIIVFLLKVKSV
jgi:hypothetical protein